MKPGTQVYRDLAEHPGDETDPGVAVIRIDGGLFFATAAALDERVRAILASQPGLHSVVLDLEGVNFVDSQGAAKMSELLELTEANGVELRLARLKPNVSTCWRRTGSSTGSGPGKSTATSTARSRRRRRRLHEGQWTRQSRPDRSQSAAVGAMLGARVPDGSEQGAGHDVLTDRPTGVTVMAVVAGITGVVDILTGLGDIGIAGGFLSDHGFGDTLDGIMTVVGLALVAIGVLGLATGFGLWRGRNWAWLITRLWASVCIVVGVWAQHYPCWATR